MLKRHILHVGRLDKMTTRGREKIKILHAENNSKTTNQKNNVIFKDYDDTKIKLHFSHFKILDPGRDTCFRDEPHPCTEKDMLVPMW